MRKSIIFLFCCLLCSATLVKGRDVIKDSAKRKVVKQGIAHPATRAGLVPSDSMKISPQDVVFHKKHRLFAALLAFPLGVFGLHRIYMHTAPGVPFIYIVTFGGLFGVLPFIDFVLILLNKDIHLTYTSNPHLFMWQKR